MVSNNEHWRRTVDFGEPSCDAMTDAQIVSCIVEGDEEAQRHTRRSMSLEVALLIEVMELYVGALSYAYHNRSQWTYKVLAQVKLMVRVFNILRAQTLLIEAGYWDEAMATSRTVHECMTLAWSLHYHPEKATVFLNGAEEIRPSEVRKELGEALDASSPSVLEGQLRNVYHHLCEETHPTSSKLDTCVSKDTTSGEYHVRIGGIANQTVASATFSILLMDYLTALRILGTIGWQEPTDQCIKRWETVDGRIEEKIESLRGQHGPY